MLEKDVNLETKLPVKLEKEEETREVQELQIRLGVTDDDLREGLGIGTRNKDVQWFQWFGYMDRKGTIRQKSLTDLDGEIKEAFVKIKESIQGSVNVS